MKIPFSIGFVTVFLAVTFFFVPIASVSQAEDRLRMQILELDFEGASRNFSFLTDKVPLNQLEIQCNHDFLKLMVFQNPENLKVYQRKSEDVLKVLSGRDHEGCAVGLLRTRLYLCRSVAAAQFSSYQQSALEVHKAWKQYKSVEEAVPVFLRDLYLGVFALIFEQVPDSYRKYINLLGMTTGGLDGFGRLNRYFRSMTSGSVEQQEAGLILLAATREFMSEPAGIMEVLDVMTSGLPSGVLGTYLKSLCLQKAGHNDAALSMLAEFADPPKVSDFPAWFYLRGRMLLYSGEKGAFDDLTTFTGHDPEANLVAAAFLKVGWHHLLRGDELRYHESRRKILAREAYDHPQDQQARNEAVADVAPDARLLALRMMIDGGYHDRCIEAARMLLVAEKRPDARAEAYYRLGRAFQMTQRTEQAIQAYEEVLKSGREVKAYWIPYSALQLGHLYLKTGKREASERAYRDCLKLNRYGYRDGIRREAEKGLRELR